MYFVLKIGIFEVKKDGNGWFAKTVILFLKYIINPSIYTNHHDKSCVYHRRGTLEDV